jgi:hypothetical protein
LQEKGVETIRENAVRAVAVATKDRMGGDDE